jgi:hypothetical protein
MPVGVGPVALVRFEFQVPAGPPGLLDVLAERHLARGPVEPGAEFDTAFGTPTGSADLPFGGECTGRPAATGRVPIGGDEPGTTGALAFHHPRRGRTCAVRWSAVVSKRQQL